MELHRVDEFDAGHALQYREDLAGLHGAAERPAGAVRSAGERVQMTVERVVGLAAHPVGVDPEISESGAAAWDPRPLGPVPGDRRPRLHVTLRLPDPTPADEYRLENLVAAARPAHMPYTVQVTAAERIPEK